MHLITNSNNSTANPTLKPHTPLDPPKTPPTKRRRYTRKEKSDFKREEASRRKGENITPTDRRRKNNSPPTPHTNGSTTRKTNTPYQGPYRIVTWNAQGLLAHDIDAQQLRRQHMLQLCSNTAILCMQETHTSDTAVEACRKISPLSGHTIPGKGLESSRSYATIS